jgi:sortase A
VDGIRHDTFPKIKYRSVWARLRVEGWTRNKEIPVYYGDNYDLLKKGAGMWQNSRFCGQNGKTVVSAHVTTHFRELETTAVGTRVTMDTVYGVYEYEVVDRIIFTPDQPEVLYPADGEDVLLLYTCYPYNNGGRTRTERLALVCKKTGGEVFAAYADRE